MTLPSRRMLAMAVGLWMAHPVLAQEPPRIQVEPSRTVEIRQEISGNQKVANAIADHLRQSGRLRHYKIDVDFQNGTAVLNGTVADQMQREQAIRLVQGVPGVERVSDRLLLVGSGPVSQVQAVAPQPQPVPPPTPATPPSETLTPIPMPTPRALPGTTNGIQEPAPVYQGNPSMYDLNPPRMPPYAWPTYAPYNNNSRVAYPDLYPYNAWPFIGPCYPFPQIPLGWRQISLTWQDGYWWYARHSTSHDWWRLRYW